MNKTAEDYRNQAIETRKKYREERFKELFLELKEKISGNCDRLQKSEDVDEMRKCLDNIIDSFTEFYRSQKKVLAEEEKAIMQSKEND